MGSLRFLLSMAVAGGHAASMFGFSGLWILPGSRAVQMFYIISGFLMAMILSEKYPDTLRGNYTFYSNRAAKIFAPYFAILIATTAICFASKAATGNGLLLQRWFDEANVMTISTWLFASSTNFFILGQEWGYLLIYRAGSLFFSLHAFSEPPIESDFTIIGPAWTLSIELLFYLIAPLIVRRSVFLIIALAFASHAFRFFAYRAGYYSEATNYRFFPFELSLFLYGSLCFRLGKFLPALDVRLSAATTAGVVVTIVWLPKYFLEHQYQLYVLVGLLLPALFNFSTKAEWDRSLGELSYPLYLVHWPIVSFLATLTISVQPSAFGTAWTYPWLAVAASISTAILINRHVLMPIDNWRQNRARDLR